MKGLQGLSSYGLPLQMLVSGVPQGGVVGPLCLYLKSC